MTHKPIAEVVGANIRALRKQRGMTQWALAKALDVTNIHVCYIESGERGISLSLIEDAAKFFNVHYARLFQETSCPGSASSIPRSSKSPRSAPKTRAGRGG